MTNELDRERDRRLKQGRPLLRETDPALNRCRCRALVRVFVGQGRLGGTWVQCSKAPRAGRRTCHWHRSREAP